MSGTLPGAIESEGAVDVDIDDDDDVYCGDDEEIRYHRYDGLRIGKAKRAINPSCIAFSDRELGKWKRADGDR